MAGYMIDTAEAIDTLVKEGMPANQARAIVRTVAQRNDEVVTKGDVQALEARLTMKIYFMAATVVATLKGLDYLGL